MAEIRKFETGATRDTDTSKYDYEGFLNPLVIERYAQYMHKHRVQPDGSLRDSDNWQKGIPKTSYMKSLLRHTMDLWSIFRGYFVFKIRKEKDEKTIISINNNAADCKYKMDIEDVLCAIIFNSMGFLLEVIKSKKKCYFKENTLDNKLIVCNYEETK